MNLLDDTPVVPGDVRPAFANANEARQVLNDAEADLQNWQPNFEPIHSSAGGMGAKLMPGIPTGSEDNMTTTSTTGPSSTVGEPQSVIASEDVETRRAEKSVPQGGHLAEATGTAEETGHTTTATAA